MSTCLLIRGYVHVKTLLSEFDKKDQIFENYNKVGNTISASIPIALKDAYKKKKLKKNHTIVIAGYGVGLSWGSSLIKWDKLI